MPARILAQTQVQALIPARVRMFPASRILLREFSLYIY